MSSTQFLMVNPYYDMSGSFTDASTNIDYQANASRNFINLIGDISNVDVSNTLYEGKTYDPSLSLVQFVKKTKRNFLYSNTNTMLDNLLYWARNTSGQNKFPILETGASGNTNNEQSLSVYTPVYSFDGELTTSTTISAPHLWRGFSADHDWSIYFKRTSSTQDGWDFIVRTPASGDWQNQPPNGIMAFNHPDPSAEDAFYIDWISGVSDMRPAGRLFAHFPFTTTTPIEYEVLVSYNSERFNLGEQSAPDLSTDLKVFYNNGSGWTQATMTVNGDAMTTTSTYADPLDQDLFIGPPERSYDAHGRLNTNKIPVSDVKLWNDTLTTDDL